MSKSNSNPPVKPPPNFIQPYSELELAEAMRELEELEAEEAAMADLSVLRRHWARRMLAAVVGCLALCVSSAALADGPTAKPKRPTICTAGTEVKGAQFTGYLCTDGKRPRLFTRFVRVSFVDSEGNAASYVLGWTSIQPKSAPAKVATIKL